MFSILIFQGAEAYGFITHNEYGLKTFMLPSSNNKILFKRWASKKHTYMYCSLKRNKNISVAEGESYKIVLKVLKKDLITQDHVNAVNNAEFPEVDYEISLEAPKVVCFFSTHQFENGNRLFV